MHISRREIEKREIGDREISRGKWEIEKSRKKSGKINPKIAIFTLISRQNAKSQRLLIEFQSINLMPRNNFAIRQLKFTEKRASSSSVKSQV